MTTELEATLGPAAQNALRTIRALRMLPETKGTVAAEKRALENINTKDITRIALILAAEEGAR
jgi:hypothetical protein